jgi:predicted transcriptional regulator
LGKKLRNSIMAPPEPMQLPSPNAGELDVLGVLWEEETQGARPLKLSEIHARVCARRDHHNDPLPALTTVSTHLRALVAKGLIREMMASQPTSSRSMRTRGMLTPATRSPLTGYQVIHSPGEVLARTMHGLIFSYPPQQRVEALADFAKVLGLSAGSSERLRQLVAEEKKLRMTAPPTAAESAAAPPAAVPSADASSLERSPVS